MATKNDRRTPWMATHPGTILKYELEDRNLTQKEFAILIGMQKSHVSEIITGKRPITMSIAEKIERKLGVSALSLVNLQNKYKYDTNVINQRKTAAAIQLSFQNARQTCSAEINQFGKSATVRVFLWPLFV